MSAEISDRLDHLSPPIATLHQLAIEQLATGLLWVTPDGQIINANPAMAQLVGTEPEQLVNQWLFDFDLELLPENWLTYCEQARSAPITLKREWNSPKGCVFWVTLQLQAVTIESQLYYCLEVHDHTEQQGLELAIQTAEFRLDYKHQELETTLNQLQEAQSQLLQGEKMSALGNLVAGVAHEINNPINFLSGNIDHALSYVEAILNGLTLYETRYPEVAATLEPDLAALDLEFIRSDLPKLLQSMHEGILRVQSLGDSLRTFARSDREQKVDVVLHDCMETTLLILKHRIKATEMRDAIRINCQYDDDQISVPCFPGQLSQVFMNILANAIDAIDEGVHEGQFNHHKSAPEITVSIQPTDDLTAMIVRIQDNGPGMPEAIQAKIFERLFTTKDVGKGTGLGLSIVQEIIKDKHDGSIAVESTIDVGTSFVITLPIA
jgi:PAS domain S-box-containing protein